MCVYVCLCEYLCACEVPAIAVSLEACVSKCELVQLDEAKLIHETWYNSGSLVS